MTTAEVQSHGLKFSPTTHRPRKPGAKPVIVGRIRERFRDRLSEWFCAANMAWTGTALLHPSDTFQSPAYQAFRSFGEDFTGWVIGLLGLLWLVGLIINGSKQKATSTIRLACALVGSLTYGSMGIGFGYSAWQSGIMNIAGGTYMLMSALALYSLYWIAVDKRTNG